MTGSARGCAPPGRSARGARGSISPRAGTGSVAGSPPGESVALRLANSYPVVAPDLIGHGDSATPRGDYSLGAHAAVVRDLLAALDIESATFVGHSLGGGIAMVFFWQ